MADVLDFRQEARGCLRLAEAETQAELKTILMGMALGWLTLAHQGEPGALEGGPADALAEETAEEIADEVA
jgi:hypothetical protein